MNLYVDMLSEALKAWDIQLNGDELLDYALRCRTRALTSPAAQGFSSYEALAAELAYDRALIHLCDEAGISTTLAAFDQPLVERSRLERALAESNIDLRALSQPGRFRPGRA